MIGFARSCSSVLVMFVLFAAAMYGCAEDEYTFSKRTRPTSGGTSKDTDGNKPAKPQSGEVLTDEVEEEDEEPADAGPPVDAAPAINAFTNTSPYALITPARQSKDHHGGKVSHAGEDCLLCHTGQGAPKFAIAGTVFSTKAATGPATGVQVRVISATGEEIALVGTDQSGNFWLKAQATIIPAGSRVGIRDGARTKLMGATIGTGACNQTGCHVSTRPIYLSD
jgi:hypothetical protein